MSVSENGEQVIERIGFAERWLDRARRQCAQGNVARGVLTLVLADAEVRHALAAAGVSRTGGAGRYARPALALLVGVLAAGLLVAFRWPTDSAPVAPTSAPPVVRLASASGSLLDTLSFPHGPAIPSVAAPVPAPATPGAAARASGGVPGPLPTAGVPDPLVVNRGSLHLSVPELIDLVLTAERALRREPTGP